GWRAMRRLAKSTSKAVTVGSSVRESSLGRYSLRMRCNCIRSTIRLSSGRARRPRNGVGGRRPERVCLGGLAVWSGVVRETSDRGRVSVRALRITPRMASENRRTCDQGTKRGEGSSRRKSFCRDYVIGVMTIAFDVSWVELDLRHKHKIWLIWKRGGSARSDLLPNGATLRKLPGGRGFFGNRVVRGESWRQWRPWGRRSDVA